MAPELTALHIADDASSWAAAGFDITDDTAVIDGVTLVFGGPAERRGIRAWSLTETTSDTGSVDGLRCAPFTAPQRSAAPGAHANSTTAIDHVVAASPDLARTTAALEAIGVDARRTRDTDQYGGPMRQVFFRLGPPILELIGPPEPLDDRPASFWGLALTVHDLDATKKLLGDGLGDPKDAVQAGRRIATLRHKAFDMSVPVAFLSD